MLCLYLGLNLAFPPHTLLIWGEGSISVFVKRTKSNQSFLTSNEFFAAYEQSGEHVKRTLNQLDQTRFSKNI